MRFDRLKARFQQVFGHAPDVFARSPWRVNLIGEHIDYEGYSVLPMALRQDTIVAIKKKDAGDGDNVLQIANVNEKYTTSTYPADPEQRLVYPYMPMRILKEYEENLLLISHGVNVLVLALRCCMNQIVQNIG